MQKRIEKLLNDLAEKHDKPYYVIYEVYMSQFKLVGDTMRSLEFKTIKLPSLGKFIASGKKVIEFKEKLSYNKYKYGTKDRTEDNKDITI